MHSVQYLAIVLISIQCRIVCSIQLVLWLVLCTSGCKRRQICIVVSILVVPLCRYIYIPRSYQTEETADLLLQMANKVSYHAQGWMAILHWTVLYSLSIKPTNSSYVGLFYSGSNGQPLSHCRHCLTCIRILFFEALLPMTILRWIHRFSSDHQN